VARFLHGLRGIIQDVLIVHTFNTVSEAQSKAKAVEQQQFRARNFVPRNLQFPSRNQYETAKGVRQPLVKSSTNLSSSRTTPLVNNPSDHTTNDRKANIHCHRCHTLEHYAHECSKARV
jgi:hypothetical protein